MALYVEDFGAKGDGKTDDTTAINAALKNTENKHVQFKNRTYFHSGSLNVPTNVRVSGNGATLRSTKSMIGIFRAVGSVSDVVIPLDRNHYPGDTGFTVTWNSHGFKPGQTIRIVGQRQIASIDAPTSERLAMATGNKNGPYNAEYLDVREVSANNKFTVSSGLIFGNYRTNRDNETHPQARDFTTVNAINWNENVLIDGFTIDSVSPNIIYALYAKNLHAFDITDIRGARLGDFVSLRGSYRSLIENCTTGYTDQIAEDVEYYQRNLFKITSSQDCVIDNCRSTGGGQVVDATYSQSYMLPTIAPVVRNCKFTGYDSNAVTTHPGVWGAVIQDNDFRMSNTQGTIASGIGIRSPYSTITGNTVTSEQRNNGVSDGNYGNYGIQLYDGGGHHCKVSGNQVTGYDIGVGILDGNESAERHGTVSTQISDNQIIDCKHSIRTRKSSAFTGWTDIAIQGNHISSNVNGAVGVNFDSNDTGKPLGTSATNNTMHFTGSSPTPIYLGSARYPVITGNTVTGTATTLYKQAPGASAGKINATGSSVTTASGMTTY